MFVPRPTTERIPYQESIVVTDDGIELAVQAIGVGPAVLIANGIGVTVPGMDVLVHHLRGRYRCISWDYRGTGQSPVSSPQSIDLSMPRHAVDAFQVLDALGVDQAAVLGWSMGVQVGLEMIRLAPARVTGFGALFGAAGTPFRHAFPGPLAELVHLAVHGSRVAPWPGMGLVRLGARVPPLAWWICSVLGFVGKTADKEIFHRDVCSTASAEGRSYFSVLAELMDHDAADMLDSVQCPVLVVAGIGDWVTPPAAAAVMAEAIEGARLLVLEDTTHFGVIEHGPALLDPVDELLEQAYPSEVTTLVTLSSAPSLGPR